jgi:hypothetical protein
VAVVFPSTRRWLRKPLARLLITKESPVKIYLLERKECGYDEYGAKVIIAKDEARARELANEQVGDEGQVWTDASQVTCTIVDTKKEMVVSAEFHAG